MNSRQYFGLMGYKWRKEESWWNILSGRRPGLLLAAVIVWSAYIISAILFGHSLWFVKILSLASVSIFGALIYNVWKNKISEEGF